MIEIKKDQIYKKGNKLKVLAVYYINLEAEEINNELLSLKNDSYKYMLYKYTTSNKRLVVIHANEIINVKARYEMLGNIIVNQNMKFINNSYEMNTLLKSIRINKMPLFLAVKQGSSKFESHTHMVINLRMKKQARKWL